MKKSMTVNLTGTALCIALGLVLPMFFHMFGAGPTFLPMHIPVLLCGLLFGWQYGAICGIIVPLLSSILTGMPPIFPTAPAMMLELCAYGILAAIFYKNFRWNVYPSLICAMIGGRIVSGAANAVFINMASKPYGFAAFLSAAFVKAVPGIVIQIVLIPVLVLALEKARIISRQKVR
ncbi:MAG TPA: ECF transporter S component [Oscillospiraceae bacterium]|nr:ECF transporter S component [Oscillospiraceae bacterium]